MKRRSRDLRDEIIAKARDAHSEGFIHAYALVLIDPNGEVDVQLDTGRFGAQAARIGGDALNMIALSETIRDVKHTDKDEEELD